MTLHAESAQPVAVSHVDSWTRLRWAGDLDIASAPVLQSVFTVLCDRDVPLLELDLTAVTFMDCAGVVPLLQARARLGDRLRLYAPSRPVTWLLELTDLTESFVVVGPAAPSPAVYLDLTEQAGSTSDDLAAQGTGLQLALSTGATIEQAKGLLMGSYGCSAPQASERLRRTSEAHHVDIGVLAEMLVASLAGSAARPVHDTTEAIRLVMGPPGWPRCPEVGGSLAGYSGPP